MGKIKDNIYNFLVRKNENVKYEYERYVMEHTVEHYEHRFLHWKILWKLNWHYRVKKNTNPLLYWGKMANNVSSTVKERQVSKISPSLKQSGNSTTVKQEKQRSLPYSRGSESKLFRLSQPYQFARSLMKYDVISFDVFDTLIFRPFANPIDLFLLLQQKYNYPNFVSIRIEMEKRAKEIAKVTKGNDIASIYEIYDLIEKYTGINQAEGVRNELELEIEMCFANSYMKKVFELLKYCNKRIIIVSDMYFTTEQISRLLYSCGYSGWEQIYVSSECHAKKRTGELFDIVASRLKLNNLKMICHIGDNYNFDVLNAREKGWAAVHYPNVHEVGNKCRAINFDMSQLVGSAYSGIVNTHIRSGIKEYSPYYEYGFIYGGIYVFGFCNWINQYILNHGIKKVLFVSRDGAIYKKIFDKFFGTVETKYCLWSRLACLKVAADYNRHNFLYRTITQQKNDKYFTLEILLNILEIENLSEELSKYNLDKHDFITEDNFRIVEKFFIDNWESIKEIENANGATESYFKQLIGDDKNICIVDVGWQGTSIKTLKWLIENKWNMDCEVHCLLAGSYGQTESSNLTEIQDESLKAYMFSQNYNRENFNFMSSSTTKTGWFELFTQDTSPTFSGICFKDGKLNFKYGVPKVEEYKFIEEIQQGIYDFCELYYKTFKEYPYMFNISGYDALRPYMFISQCPIFFKDHIGELCYPSKMYNDFNPDMSTTVKDLVQRKFLKL